MQRNKYECLEPPCIHVVVDDTRKIYAVFFEDWEGNIYLVKASEIMKASETINRIKNSYREATDSEADKLAEEYLGAEPVEEE
ncbi:conserved hypothetical protein [Ignisphaera aggregans DSM 17230]|uniref:Uncharacterized protein n=1 Tax=Ignisphaera aggregans (strain DSM 17230 / JCM 13409 / AQ1.S1) TaxID=583356 RepID=E0SRK2_IGNAA|nr:conserved hypothetical protein [Ignisphaera aggregans DSM 17230]